ncbi:MAG: sigma-70 family RNA polymerase sigma factor [Tannerellaceae bacterium]|jgi:RNA polymerase sigma-70 factor (ECF subfamily)|nr:sigma-70 family RNA polymerase sigma factor [Tannerellaceae bacterium]
MELYTDTYYIKRIQEGDTTAYTCILDKYSRQVYSLAFKVVHNKEDAEELAQDVFLKVFKHLNGFKGDSSFSTWVYRIAYNTAISYTRKKKQEYLAIEEAAIANVAEEEEEVADALEQTDSDRQMEILDKALAQLPPDERAMILFFYMEGKSIDEIASITAFSVSNVKTKLHRIRKKLFVLIKETERIGYE